MNVQPYVFFDGKCEEALEFYKGAIGAKVDMMMRFSESPEKPQPGMVPPGSENKLFNAVGKGGQVQMPLGKTFFASRFGMVTDKFGVLWLVIAEKS
jgi:PhnB protein